MSVVSRCLNELARNRAFLDECIKRGLAWILEDISHTYAFERALYRTLSSILDVCEHFVLSAAPEVAVSRSECPRKLAEMGRMDAELAKSISGLAKLESLLAGPSFELDYDLLFKEAKNLVENVIPAFSEWVKRQL